MSRLKPVNDVKEGLYVWRMLDGTYFGDGYGNLLSIPSAHGDIRRMADIADAAKHYGVEGEPVFIPGARQISDSEHDDQMERMIDGKLPDPFDVGALRDEVRAKHERRGN